MTSQLTPALYLIPCTLGDTSVEQVLPPYNREVILQLLAVRLDRELRAAL